jgi:hypothetical protein
VTFAKELLETFSTQVETIAVGFDLASQLSPDLLSRIKHKTLVGFLGHLSKLTTHDPNLRVGIDGPTSTFTNVVRYIEELPSSNPSTLLYLPPDFIPIATHSMQSSISSATLVEKCAARNVEVIFEDQVKDWVFFLRPSPDFARRMKEKKLQGSQE